jgi:hypothetical protein
MLSKSPSTMSKNNPSFSKTHLAPTQHNKATNHPLNEAKKIPFQIDRKKPSNKSESTSLNTPNVGPNNSQLPVTQNHPDHEARIKRLSEQLNRMEHSLDDLKRIREALDRLVREYKEDHERKCSGQK